jgi:hypothetical protein
MNKFCSRNIFFFLLLIDISIVLSSYPNNYTFPLLYKVRIGSQSTEIQLLLNSFDANSLLFTNSNRDYFKQISEGRKSDVFIDKLEFNGNIIQGFPFSLILDNTGILSKDIQGEFGLGIDKDNKNDLIENLYLNQIIPSRKIILEISEDLKKVYLNLDSESAVKNFKFCNLTRKIDLDKAYSEAWVCELSHIIEIEDNTVKSNDETFFENALPVNARALFDTRQKYLIFPLKYIQYFKHFLTLDNCEIIIDRSLNERYFQCNKSLTISEKKSLYFIIGGYGLIFNPNELFEENDKYKYSIIRFTDSINQSNLFVFGIPLFKKYNIMFNYDNKNLGFKGNNIYDFTKIYKEWLEKKSTVKIIPEVKKEGDKKDIINNDSDDNDYIETIIMLVGLCVGICIILYVGFYTIRSFKRSDENKMHSQFVEQHPDY